MLYNQSQRGLREKKGVELPGKSKSILEIKGVHWGTSQWNVSPLQSQVRNHPELRDLENN